MTRPRQWRHECPCAETVARERRPQPWMRMHSEVTVATADYFASGDRLHGDLDAAELAQLVRDAAGTVICCNVCGRLRQVEVPDEGADQDTDAHLAGWST